jgi:hypothetical protein
MSWINRPLIVECLRELSDRAAQQRLWLSTGHGDVSSFTEAIEQLFTDSGLDGELQKRTTGLGVRAEDTLMKLRDAARHVDRAAPRDKLIESAEMQRVRELAAASLRAIEGGT